MPELDLLELDTAVPPAPHVLHGSWSENAFFVWAESLQPMPRLRGRMPRLPQHPGTLLPGQVRLVLRQLAPLLDEAAVTDAQRTVLLPSHDRRPLRSAPAASEEDAADVPGSEPPTLLPWRIPGLELAPLAALDLLVALPYQDRGERLWGADIRYWGLVAKLVLELLARQKFLPGMVERDGQYRAAWLPVLDETDDLSRLNALARAMPPVCRALSPEKAPEPDGSPEPHALLESAIGTWIDCAVRDWGHGRLDGRRAKPSGAPGAWWAALWGDPAEIDVPFSERRELIRLWEAWRTWAAQLHGVTGQGFRLCFRLEPPEIDPDSERPTSSAWTLRYMLQASDDLSLLVPAENVWQARGSAMTYLSHKFEGAQERLLAGLGLAARTFAPIMDSLRTARPGSCSLSADQAYAFLREAGPLLESSGFGVLVPPWWNKPEARLSVRARAKSTAQVIGKGLLTMDALVQFEWELALGDQALSHAEFERLAKLKIPLVEVRGQWVMLNPREIEAAIAFWEKRGQEKQVSLGEALGLALGADPEAEGLPLQSIETSGWIEELLRTLKSGDQQPAIPPPAGLAGQLRPYQQRGVAWLDSMRGWRLGSCLADDMGLGKTIQAIALLLLEREQVPPGKGKVNPALVICPTSVVGNWKREIQRFAPGLTVMIHHGTDRAKEAELVAAAQAHDVVISTYGLARRDVEDLVQVPWSDVILDEAQNIKNPQAKQTQAIRKLRTVHRIALTGTPVENRLSELWSIMQFLNPGLLGSQAGFRRRFALPIERYQDRDASEQLKRLVGPFILRRVKTDPSIIQDLPDKIDSKVYCTLTAEQATLYEATVQEALQRVESTDETGIERRGIVLSMLMRLKQICNHPAQFLGDGSALPNRSGKLERLGEMLEEALEVGDRALVFTQFAEMGHMLQAHLRALFGVEVLFLYGGTARKQREQMVERFQRRRGAPPILVLSLKAGGTGLNLTAANHVFHFDRWWNPAVENQATDRAFRIGQTRDVQVFKFICAGTLEERIDELIESKKALAESIIGSGENWLTELSNDDLRTLVTLQRE
jgi:SNF2 family DNA or RNA helicase